MFPVMHAHAHKEYLKLRLCHEIKAADELHFGSPLNLTNLILRFIRQLLVFIFSEEIFAQLRFFRQNLQKYSKISLRKVFILTLRVFAKISDRESSKIW